MKVEKPSKAQGYVFYRKSRKRWTVRYPEYDAKDGKNITKSKDFRSEEEAKLFLASINYQKENELYIENNGIPLCEFMRSNQKIKLDANQISDITYFRNMQTIEQIEKYAIGKENVDEITSEEVQEFMNAHKNLSNSTINKLYHMLGATFKNAINRGYIYKDPMANVIKPKSIKIDKKVRAMTFEEQQAFTEFLLSRDLSNCKYKNVYLIQMFMGLRIGEALALKIGDIDLKNQMMNITKTLTKDELGKTIMGKTTKTYAGRRTLPIPDFLMDSIIEQMEYAECQTNNEEKLLFKPEDRKYVDRENANTELKRLLKKYFGIEDITTHSLRHTYGTRCIESGMAPVVVQRLMGHTDIKVTLNTYTSVYDEFKAKEVEKVNKYFLERNMINNNLLDEYDENELDEIED